MALIYTHFDEKTYLYSNDVTDKDDVYVPLNVDTEFYTRALDDPLLATNPSQTITVQIKGVNENKGKIYTHLDSKEIARHSLFTESFIGFQYLIDNGYQITFQKPKIITNKQNSIDYPKIHFHLYLHFACADLIRLFYGEFQDDIRKLILNAKGSGNNQGITQNRRLQTYFRGKGGYKNHCYLNWYVNYQDITYQVVLTVYDTIAIAGNKSYSDLADLVGFNLPYKTLLNEQDKENMNITYLNNENFDDYALGDLYAYDLLIGFNNQYNHLLQSILDIPDNERLTTRLTIGSSIARILGLKLKQLSSLLKDKKIFKELTVNANSDELRKYKDTRAILSKVDGGRCYNNRPLNTVVSKNGNYKTIDELVKGLNILCDIDISGAYGKGLSLQDYPLGKPKNFCHQLNKENKYLTLREFLNKHGNELVDGLWIMRVNTVKPLKYSQDLIASWVIDPNKIDRLTDPTNDDLSVDYPKEGYCKIFTNEINLGLITSDILQWIDNICSRDQRIELYDNLLVINAQWYDKSKELKTVDDVIEKLNNFDLKDESYYQGDDLMSIQRESYYWCRVNLGELLINKLIETREKYPKKQYPKENEFLKLCINTTYGVLVSKFFNVSNTVVGNNITARCRCMMYYLEKGLNGFQSITDGCIFELDKVTYPVDGKRLTANNLVKGYQRQSNDRKWFTDKLKINEYYHLYHGDFFIGKVKTEIIENANKKVLVDSINVIDYMSYVNQNKPNTNNNVIHYYIENDILEHLRNIFPNVDVLHKKITNHHGNEQLGYYTLEIKCFGKTAIFHGNANYYLNDVTEQKSNKLISTGKPLIKMRGYTKNSYMFDTNDDLDNEIDIVEYILSNLDDELDCIDNPNITEDINLLGVNVPEKFFDSLKINPSAVTRQNYFIVSKIIKCKDYKQNHKTYEHTKLEIGYSVPECKLLTELVLSQFTYPNQTIFETWTDRHYKHKNKYGQGYESCFLNDDQSLNYQLMIETIDQKIKDNKTIKLKPIDHPEYKYLTLRKQDIQEKFIV